MKEISVRQWGAALRKLRRGYKGGKITQAQAIQRAGLDIGAVSWLSRLENGGKNAKLDMDRIRALAVFYGASLAELEALAETMPEEDPELLLLMERALAAPEPTRRAAKAAMRGVLESQGFDPRSAARAESEAA